jgi:CubicO group peptidase (beta-lactamase class C family)
LLLNCGGTQTAGIDDATPTRTTPWPAKPRRPLLTEAAVAELSADHLTEEQRDGPSASIFLDGEGWGHGVQVRFDPALPRRYGRGGGLGTTWYNFPDHGVTAVLMTQHLPPLGEPILHFWKTLDDLLGAA